MPVPEYITAILQDTNVEEESNVFNIPLNIVIDPQQLKDRYDDLRFFGDTHELFNREWYILIGDDIKSLSKKRWLNDHIIIRYFEMLKAEQPEVFNMPIFRFDAYKDMIAGREEAYGDIREDHLSIEISAYDMLLVPVYSMCHWTLIVVKPNEKIMDYYDSYERNSTKEEKTDVLELYLEFLTEKFPHVDKENWKYNVHDVPQQNNDYDCGIFCCIFAKYVSKEVQFNFQANNMLFFRALIAYGILNERLIEFENAQ